MRAPTLGGGVPTAWTQPSAAMAQAPARNEVPAWRTQLERDPRADFGAGPRTYLMEREMPGVESLEEDSLIEAWRRRYDASNNGMFSAPQQPATFMPTALQQHEAAAAVARAVAAQEASMAAMAAQESSMAAVAAGQDTCPTAVVFGAERFDSAVAAYGVQLKSWIDLQVESRLNQFFQGFDGEMIGVRQDCHAALNLCERLEGQVLAVTDSQVRLNAKIETIVDETGRLKGAVAACNVNSNTAWERENSNISAQLVEMRRRCDQQQADSSRSERALGEHAEMLRRLNSIATESAREQEQNASVLQRELESLAKVVQHLQDDLGDHRDKPARLELAELGSKLRSENAEKHASTAEALRSEAAGLEKRLLRLEGLDIMEALAHRQSESKRETALIFEQFQVRVADDMSGLQHRLLATMRAELTAAFRSEAAAVTALDEQLWLKDQKMRQQADKVTSQKTRERIAVIERGDAGVVASPSTSPGRGLLRETSARGFHAVSDLAAGNGLVAAAEVTGNGTALVKEDLRWISTRRN